MPIKKPKTKANSQQVGLNTNDMSKRKANDSSWKAKTLRQVHKVWDAKGGNNKAGYDRDFIRHVVEQNNLI